MTDWATTISALATGGGTLVLAIATFAAVRSSNRSARIAEASMMASMRPVLTTSQLQDPVQKIAFVDGVMLAVPGGSAAIEMTDQVIYLVLSIRNAGTGMGVLHGWRIRGGRQAIDGHPTVDEFTTQTRDMYVAPGDVAFWQGALRDPDAGVFKEITAAIQARDILTLDLLYGNIEGGQRIISRFNLDRRGDAPRYGDGRQHDDETIPGGARARSAAPGGSGPDRPGPVATYGEGRWLAAVTRHWNVDRPDPR